MRGKVLSWTLGTIFSAVVFATVDADGANNKPTEKPERSLSLPVPEKCANRPKEWQYNGKNYFFTGHIVELKDKKFDWLDGRNLCREYCMDLVSLETQEENNLIFRLIQKNNLSYIWTSGRLCDFKGCEKRTDLEPKNLNGWFWSATRAKLYPTNKVIVGWTYNPWSQTGHKKVPQPDNAEYEINQTEESCLAVQNNLYEDGIAWHDVACYHEKPIVCEDNQELLDYVETTNPGLLSKDKPPEKAESKPSPPAQTTNTSPAKPERKLASPIPEKCSSRSKQFTIGGKNYFFSGDIAGLKGKKFDWLDGRNLCRESCMDLVSLETQAENNKIFVLIRTHNISHIWTSGHLCDSADCAAEAKNQNGWFWSATRAKLHPTNQVPQRWTYNPWSQTGQKKVPQPDNADTNEACLAVLNNEYNDGIKWHDVACQHEKPVVCEDSEELLNEVASTNPGIRL